MWGASREQLGERVGRGGEGGTDGAIFAAKLQGMQQCGDGGLARIGGGGEGDEGAEALLELERGGWRGTRRDQFEIHDIAKADGEGEVPGKRHEIVGVGEIAFEGKRGGTLNGDPNGMIGGDGFGGGEDGGRGVRSGGGGDEGGRPKERDAGGDLRGAGDCAARDGEQFDSGGGDQNGVGVAEGLEEREGGGGEFRVKGRGAELVEIDAGERDGGRRDERGEGGIDGGWRSGTAGIHEDREGENEGREK